MSTRHEIANLNRAALVAHQEWGTNDPRTRALSARIAELRERLKHEEGEATGGFFAKKVSPALMAQRAADEAALRGHSFFSHP